MRYDRKVARDLALRRLMTNRRQQPAALVNRKDGNAVMAAIGAINKLAGRMHMDIRTVAAPGKAGGQGRAGLQFG